MEFSVPGLTGTPPKPYVPPRLTLAQALCSYQVDLQSLHDYFRALALGSFSNFSSVDWFKSNGLTVVLSF